MGVIKNYFPAANRDGTIPLGRGRGPVEVCLAEWLNAPTLEVLRAPGLFKMEKEFVQAALSHTPFKLFQLKLADGSTVDVKGKEFAFTAPGRGRSVFVYNDDGVGGRFVDTALVLEIIYPEVDINPPMPPKEK